MSFDNIQAQWTEIKGKIQQTWGKITNDHIMQMKGSYEELSGMLQREYNYSKEDASKKIREFLDKEGFNKAKENLVAAKEDLKNAKDHLLNK